MHFLVIDNNGKLWLHIVITLIWGIYSTQFFDTPANELVAVAGVGASRMKSTLISLMAHYGVSSLTNMHQSSTMIEFIYSLLRDVYACLFPYQLSVVAL